MPPMMKISTFAPSRSACSKNNNKLYAPRKKVEDGTENRKAQRQHLLNEQLSLLAFRVVSTRGRTRSCWSQRAFKLDDSVICIYLGENRVLRTECRDVQAVTCSSSCFVISFNTSTNQVASTPVSRRSTTPEGITA